jgi:hypothetical protein
VLEGESEKVFVWERGRDSVKVFVCVCGRQRDGVRMRKCSYVDESERDSLDMFKCKRKRKREYKRETLYQCILAEQLKLIVSKLKW